MNNIKCNLSDKIFGNLEIKVIERETGKVVDSFSDKNVIVLDSKQAITRSISGNSSGHITTLRVGDDVGDDVTITGSPSITFNDVNPDTIVRNDGGSFITDGFIDDMSITVIGSSIGTNNSNSPFIIATGGVTASTITLSSTDVLTTITDVSGVSITGTASQTNPITAVDSYNETTMTPQAGPNGVGLYKFPGTFSIGYPNTTSVNFSLTLSGEDFMSYYPSDSSKLFTSASLHSEDGNVFAYKRFPKKSISDVIDISIVWTITY